MNISCIDCKYFREIEGTIKSLDICTLTGLNFDTDLPSYEICKNFVLDTDVKLKIWNWDEILNPKRYIHKDAILIGFNNPDHKSVYHRYIDWVCKDTEYEILLKHLFQDQVDQFDSTAELLENMNSKFICFGIDRICGRTGDEFKLANIIDSHLPTFGFMYTKRDSDIKVQALKKSIKILEDCWNGYTYGVTIEWKNKENRTYGPFFYHDLKNEIKRDLPPWISHSTIREAIEEFQLTI